MGAGGYSLLQQSHEKSIMVYAFPNIALYLANYSRRIADTDGEKLESWKEINWA